MKRFLRTLKARLSHPDGPVTTNRSSNAVAVEDVLMPDIYADQRARTSPEPQAPTPSSPDGDKTRGFNPYDTGVFQEK